ncbi:hypothetical protein [Asticcacaulis excentricus]|uniref:Uncharacterized protein n=1 Tax=Asticcacaulis excentricus (strain ATCC 15261 / DSM 4724 / KCTC 12464 / NCIMB 9791 / VKM B-1370 / CB 48) TaxID=573065 RepID=E8RUJ2_ASTEC|nr:hypothetical protein [Asticcacaulis excentricus]ADU14080.1 hypothetical protein Astex_2429 [Asticcacaulis excentricus CB 48]
MSPERCGNAGEDGLDQAISRGIDSLGRLRADMRQAGLTDCADLLDEAFVCCLKAFVGRRETFGRPPPSVDDEPQGQAE